MKFDVIQHLPPSIEFKGPNRRGYIILEICPFCSGRKKLYINVDQQSDIFGLCKCFKCNYIKNIRQFMEEIGCPLKTEIQQLNEEIDIFSLKRPKTQSIQPKMYLQSINMLNLTKDHTKGMEYLKRRGMTERHIADCGVSIYDEDPIRALEGFVDFDALNFIKTIYRKKFDEIKLALNNRLEQKVADIVYYHIILRGRAVFPVTLNNRLVGYVARDYTGEAKPKVLNSGGELTTKTLWNIDNVTGDVLYLHEGIFNAVTCGLNNSVAMLGKNLSDDAIEMILKKKIQTVAIVLDIDARKEAYAIKKRISSLFDQVVIMSVPEEVKDINVLRNLVDIKVIKNEQLAYKDYEKLLIKYKNSPLIDEIKKVEWKDLNDFGSKDVLLVID